MADKLNDRQRELLKSIESELRRECALEYVKSGYSNQTQAYLNACSKLGKSPSKNPAVSASEILNYPNVVAFINSLKEQVVIDTQIDAGYVLRRLKQIDELDVIDIVMDDMSGFRPLKEWPKEWRISVSGIDMKRMIQMDGDTPIESIVEKIKWPDKVKNLEMIGRHVDVKAWDKDKEAIVTTHHIMLVPTADSVEDWEKAAQAQQSEALSHD